MTLFCPTCGDELEGFDPRYSKEWPRHCGEQMVQLRGDDPTPAAKPMPAPVEYLPSDDPGVMDQTFKPIKLEAEPLLFGLPVKWIDVLPGPPVVADDTVLVEMPDKWYLEPDDSQGAAERIGKRLADDYRRRLTEAWWAALDREMGGALKQEALTCIADQINAMIDSRVTRPTEAISLQELSREMERTDG